MVTGIDLFFGVSIPLLLIALTLMVELKRVRASLLDICLTLVELDED